MDFRRTFPAGPMFKCGKCNRNTFCSAEALVAHQAALGHYLACPECKEEFRSRNALLKHKTVHKQKTPSQNKKATTILVMSSKAESPGALNPHTSSFHGQQLPPSVPETLDNLTYGGVFLHIILSRADISHNSGQSGRQQGHCRGHPFIVLSEVERDLLYRKLLERCHPSPRLRLQGYTLSAESSKRFKARAFLPTPLSFPGQSPTKRKAIALDCEMVGVVGQRSELAYLSAVDFITGEVLINNYVQPTRKVTNWRSRTSGVTRAAMDAAVAAGQAFSGWYAARQVLWEYVDAETVLIGHSLNYDLDVLRMLHPKVVDSSILTGEAVFTQSDERLKRLWCLKKLAKAFLDRDIQTGSNGHDCLEDTLATRDVVIWCLRNPGELTAWAERARAEHALQLEQQRERAAQRRQERENSKKEEGKQMRQGEKQCLAEQPGVVFRARMSTGEHKLHNPAE